MTSIKLLLHQRFTDIATLIIKTFYRHNVHYYDVSLVK